MTTFRGTGTAGAGGVVSVAAENVSITDTAGYYTATNVEDALAETRLAFVGVYSSTQELTNKTINLANNTLTGTTAEFNTALTDGDFATLAGTETLTNKTISVDNNTVSGVAASSFVLSNASGNIDGAAAQKAIPTGTVVGTSDTQTLTNKTLTGALASSTLADNTADLSLADAKFVKSQIANAVNMAMHAQGVYLPYAASGGIGMTVTDNSNIDVGTKDFTLHFEGALMDWTPTGAHYLFFKRDGTTDAYVGYNVYINLNNGYPVFTMYRNSASFAVSSGVNPGFTNGTFHKMTVVVTRETASAAGSAAFYADEVLLATTAITAAATVSLDNTGNLQIAGIGGERAASVNASAAIFNYALTAAEVLDLHRNGISYAQKYGSQTPIYTSDFSAGVDGWAAVTAGSVINNASKLRFTHSTGSNGVARSGAYMTKYKNYRLDFKSQLISGTAQSFTVRGVNLTFSNVSPSSTFTPTLAEQSHSFVIRGAEDDDIYFNKTGNDAVYDFWDIIITPIGATLRLEPEGITAAGWQDSSSNNLDATYPSGASLVRTPYGSLVDTLTNKTIVAASNTITTAASGSLVATELNAALAELDSDITAHLTDTVDAHDASAISIVDAGGYFTGTDAEAVLQEVGADLLTVGLQYFTEGRNTTPPNDTVPVHSFTATGAETNIDAVISPKGSGALSADIADSTATGGNKRGTYAVDWQAIRTAAAQVASGNYSVIGGGYGNTSSGEVSIVSGGYGNTSSGIYSAVSGGFGNTSSGGRAVIAGGINNTASNERSVVSGGELNTASGQYSSIPGGYYGTTRGLYGRYSYASGRFSATGDAQIGCHVQRLTTTDATASIVTADGSATPSTANVSVLPDNHAYTAVAYITARDTSTGDMASFKIEGAVKRGSGAGTTALVGTPTATTIAADAGASTWAVALVANTTRGSVEVQVTGEAATTIHWVCKLDTVEVG